MTVTDDSVWPGISLTADWPPVQLYMCIKHRTQKVLGFWGFGSKQYCYVQTPRTQNPKHQNQLFWLKTRTVLTQWSRTVLTQNKDGFWFYCACLVPLAPSRRITDCWDHMTLLLLLEDFKPPLLGRHPVVEKYSRHGIGLRTACYKNKNNKNNLNIRASLAPVTH